LLHHPFVMSFRVQLEPGGEVFDVRPDETVLDAALRAGLVLPHDCRIGRCGSCLARVVTGTVETGEAGGSVLSDIDRAAGRALLCQARPVTDLTVAARPLAALAGIKVRTLTVRVARIERLAPGVVRLALKLPGGVPFRFLPGQHVDVQLRDGGRRSYSIASSPEDGDRLELHVREVAGGIFSGQVLAALREKDLLRLQGPFGTFVLDHGSSRPAILLAGGTGYAPLRSMLRHAIQSGITRPLHLYRGARTVEDLYLADEGARLAASHPAIRYTPVVTEPDTAGTWRTGLAHAAVLEDYPDLRGHAVYASGPPAMIARARAAFGARGLPDTHFHADAFEPAGR
jgi:CDP-4-dehydro-6-deoxyglucose reductase